MIGPKFTPGFVHFRRKPILSRHLLAQKTRDVPGVGQQTLDYFLADTREGSRISRNGFYTSWSWVRIPRRRRKCRVFKTPRLTFIEAEIKPLDKSAQTGLVV